MICHDRSGSNLLRGMINQHPEVYVIPPLPIFEIIYYYQEVFGDLSIDANWKALLEQISDLYDVNHYPLPFDMGRKVLSIRAANAPRTLGGAVQCVFDHLAESSGKKHVGLKFGAYHYMVGEFLRETNFERAVFQTRDPRDVALSAWKAGVDNRQPADFAKHWIEWHRGILHHLADASVPYVQHRYEDLLDVPELTLGRLWNFLDVAPINNALEFYKADDQKEAAETSYMWRNVSKPLDSTNKNKFYGEWGPKVTHKIERMVGYDALLEFGYQPSRFWRFPPKSYFKHAMPLRHRRTSEDSQFQKRQNEISADLQARYLALNTS